jgi:hypothetical protein
MNSKRWLIVVGAVGALFLCGGPEYALADSGVVVQDAFVLGYYPDSNRGDSDTMLAGNDSSAWRMDALVQFDLPPNPDGLPVGSATLGLFNSVLEWANRGDAEFGAVGVTSSWDESTVTWDTAPSDDGTVYGVEQFLGVDPPHDDREDLTPEEWKSWDVTALVQSWYDGSLDNNGIKIVGMVNLGGDGASLFPQMLTKEFGDSALWPTLDVTLVPEPSTVTLLLIGLAGMVGCLIRRRR